jgi:uncharacterized protein
MRLHEPDGYECRSAASSESGGLAMRPRIHVVTLAAADLDRALTFYRDGMGFPTEGLIGTEFQGDEGTPDGATAVFQLDGGLMLSVYPRSELAKGISETTVKTHVTHILQKLGLRDRVQAVVLAYQAGLFEKRADAQ